MALENSLKRWPLLHLYMQSNRHSKQLNRLVHWWRYFSLDNQQTLQGPQPWS